MALPTWIESAVNRMSEDQREELSLMLVSLSVDEEVWDA